MHNIITGESGPEQRKGEGFWQGAAVYAAADTAEYYQSGGSTIGLFTGGMTTAEKIVEAFKS